MNDLYLYRRHLYVEREQESLCGNEKRPEDASSVFVEVDHLRGMELLCDDCHSRAEQWQHLRGPKAHSDAEIYRAAVLTIEEFLKIFIITAIIVAIAFYYL